MYMPLCSPSFCMDKYQLGDILVISAKFASNCEIENETCQKLNKVF